MTANAADSTKSSAPPQSATTSTEITLNLGDSRGQHFYGMCFGRQFNLASKQCDESVFGTWKKTQLLVQMGPQKHNLTGGTF